MQGDVGSGRRWRADPMVIAVNALGITQITAGAPATTAWASWQSRSSPTPAGAPSTVFLGFTVALLTMGFVSTASAGSSTGSAPAR